jgi:hypothetical protein
MIENTTKKEEDRSIISFILSGEKLPQETNNLDLISKVGSELYQKNREYIKEKVKDNWFVVIEPVSGTLIASPDQLELYQYAKTIFPERLFFSVGLVRDNLLYYAR